ncbi:TetR/AcrR family transcriptional regulator [Jannaschia sp. CCS1]|uniref:TetR/AcrR family transcriptional regulator n=1 Tax=Jannaschia sp. (strain CCS1) TaxID=290400 RepID=UPI000053CF99|nr:TetR/AcrR family transcriptional regulator [Jannaschia sp. CCS1]ABD53426.1 transcriptional regulator, TetR family [Jannaschia sp. CCS1]
MEDKSKEARRRQIEDAAYKMLGEKGYAGTSMQGIARAAKASNETLYNWYGDKKGLMAALIARNTDTVRDTLSSHINADPLDRLAHLGPTLLAMVLGSRAVALNRAAAADPSGDLGRALARGGRETVAPMVTALMTDSPLRGQPDRLTQLYLTLLIGDLQIRRATGAMEPPTQEFCTTRAAEALDMLKRLAT